MRDKVLEWKSKQSGRGKIQKAPHIAEVLGLGHKKAARRS
ncbi:hypothetical protein QE357_001308 [Siphonobacter sp. BAB-5404]|nr:hypothetical protein [Siphonobacter sp. SORGH_AS_0500]